VFGLFLTLPETGVYRFTAELSLAPSSHGPVAHVLLCQVHFFVVRSLQSTWGGGQVDQELEHMAESAVGPRG
jgi:hypothetical protein